MPPSFQNKAQGLDYESLIWRAIDRIQNILAMGLSQPDQHTSTGINPLNRQIIISLHSSIRGLECLLYPKLVGNKEYWGRRGQIMLLIKNTFKSIHDGEQGKQVFIDYNLDWLQLIMEQLPKMKLMPKTKKELESGLNELD